MLKLQNLGQNRNSTRKLSRYNANLIIEANIDRVIECLNLELQDVGSYYKGKCHIHGGDGYALTIYKNGKWFCWSHHCEQEYNGMFGFVMATLGYTEEETIEWVNNNFSGPVPPPIIREPVRLKQDKIRPETRSEVRSKLKIPSQYYLDKNFSRDILDEYDVGVCMNPNAAMYGRTVFPIYNDNWDYLGCTGRTIYPVTEKNPKWKHHNISTGNYFYNLQKMLQINKKQSVILVESCGNVLRLAEAGYLSLGCFGTQLTTQQCIRLEMSNVHTIYLGYDPDEAGEKATKRAMKKLHSFKVIPIVGMTKDFGDMSVSEIKQLLGEQNVNCTFR